MTNLKFNFLLEDVAARFASGMLMDFLQRNRAMVILKNGRCAVRRSWITAVRACSKPRD